MKKSLLKIFSLFVVVVSYAFLGQTHYAFGMVTQAGDNEQPMASYTLVLEEGSAWGSEIGWQVEIVLAKEGRGTPWIDWNDNGKREDDEILRYDTHPEKVFCNRKSTGNSLKIYADLEMLSCPGNAISAIEMHDAQASRLL